MSLDKSKDFNSHLGTQVDRVRYVQDGKAYANNEEYLGTFKDGKLTPKKAAETPDETPVTGDADTDSGSNPLKALLDQSIAKVKALLSGLTNDELNELESLEADGENRVGMLAAIAEDKAGRDD